MKEPQKQEEWKSTEASTKAAESYETKDNAGFTREFSFRTKEKQAVKEADFLLEPQENQMKKCDDESAYQNQVQQKTLQKSISFIRVRKSVLETQRRWKSRTKRPGVSTLKQLCRVESMHQAPPPHSSSNAQYIKIEDAGHPKIDLQQKVAEYSNLSKEVKRYATRLQSHLNRSKYAERRGLAQFWNAKRQKGKFSNIVRDVSRNHSFKPHNLYPIEVNDSQKKILNFQSSQSSFRLGGSFLIPQSVSTSNLPQLSERNHPEIIQTQKGCFEQRVGSLLGSKRTSSITLRKAKLTVRDLE